MTKLGVTPGVHGEDEKSGETVTDSVKVDPKVFTVLQPTVIPIQAPPAAEKPRRSFGSSVLRGILLFLLFISCFIAGLVLLYGADTLFNGVYVGDQNTATSTVAPAEQFSNPMGNDQKDAKPDDEMKVFVNAIPVAKVMVIEGGNTPDANVQQKAMNERPLHPYEQQEAPLEAYNNRPMMPPPMWVLQARQMEQAQAMRQWRWRRLQQAIFEQQMMREAMARAEWAQAEQQQRAIQEEQLARAIAQARWEQMQRARAMEEYQAEVQRAQWEQAQRANWERLQMLQQQQLQQQFLMPQQPWWPRHQPQQQQNFVNPRYPQQFYFYPQQVPPQQQQQQQFFFPQQQPFQNQQQQWPVPQPQQQPQVLTRPHDASPAQILSMQQPTVPPAPEMGMHDKIYQEMQKKSQFMEFNVPSKPIWTAITPTPESPGNYDHDAIFQENMKKINEMSTTTAAPVTTVKVAEIKPVEGENPFRDILSVFDEAEKKGENAAVTTENVFKLFEDKATSTEAPKIEKEPVKDVVDNAAQIDVPTENVPKPAEEQKPEPENIFKAVEEQKPEEAQIPDEDSEGPVAPVVIEDRFPRLGARTTVPVETTTPVADVENDEDMEHDPLAAFLRYFEQEAQKMRGPHPKTAVVDSEVRKEDPKTEQPPAVDVPEPHFQEFQQDPRLVVD